MAMTDRWPGLKDPRLRRTFLLVVAGITAGVIAVSFALAEGLRSAGFEVSEWQVLLALMGLGAVSVLQGEIDRPPPPPPRKERIRELTMALEQATDLVDELRTEIAQGEELAARYQADVARFEHLAALKREEVQAVAVELRSEVRLGSRRGMAVGLLTNTVVGAAFFALGLWVQT
jgi:hypothetical protein